MYAKPVEDNMATEVYKRETEIQNVVALLNMLNDLGLHDWNPGAPSGDTMQRNSRECFGRSR